MSENITVSVKAWSEAMQTIPPNCNDIYNAINEVVLGFPKEEQYVYFAQFPFGTKLITNGSIPIDRFSFTPNNVFLPKNKDALKKDLEYSNDPLGVVLKKHIEIYCPNKSNLNEYNVPINIIKEGEFFGLFGTLDSLNKNDEILLENYLSFTNPPEWNAVAGNVCFEILFPFDNDTAELGSNFSDFKKPIDAGGNPPLSQIHFSESENISFIKTCLGDEKWTVDVIYFPKKIIEKSTIKLQNLLYKIGWQQSRYLRNALFETKLISDKIKSITLQHEDLSLATLYNYLLKIMKDDAYILKPIIKNHILATAINKFIEDEDISKYIRGKKNFFPVILGYEKLGTNDWGILSTDWLPILLKHSVIDIKSLGEDLNAIIKRCGMNQFQLKYVTRNKTPIEKVDLQKKIQKMIGKDDNFHTKIYLTGYSLHNFLIVEKCSQNIQY